MEQITKLTAAFAALNERIDVLEGLVVAIGPAKKAKKATNDTFPIYKVERYVGDVKRYATDLRYMEFLTASFMPRSKLLKLSKCSASVFEEGVNAALAAGVIRQVIVKVERTGKQAICYVTAKRYQAVQHREVSKADQASEGDVLMPWDGHKFIYI